MKFEVQEGANREESTDFQIISSLRPRLSSRDKGVIEGDIPADHRRSAGRANAYWRL